jgi:hypothetical protein
VRLPPIPINPSRVTQSAGGIIYHQELAILSRFINDVDRFMHAATFGEGERFAYARDLMAVVRAVFLGQIEGRAPWASQGSRVTSEWCEQQQSASCASSKGAGSFHATVAGSSFLWIVLISLAWRRR